MDDNPHQPTFRPTRRACPSELKATIRALKKALRKEEKRADKMHALRAEIEELHGRLTALRRS